MCFVNISKYYHNVKPIPALAVHLMCLFLLFL